MPSAKNPAAKPATTIINATARTRSVIEGLQAKLAAERPNQLDDPESIEELERQLQAYFERTSLNPSRSPILEDLRKRVIEGAVERILAEWPNSSELGREVMDRLIEHVLREFRRTVGSAD